MYIHWRLCFATVAVLQGESFEPMSAIRNLWARIPSLFWCRPGARASTGSQIADPDGKADFSMSCWRGRVRV